MKLRELAEAAGAYAAFPGIVDFEVRGISCNSKEVKNDFLFVSIAGSKRDGHLFIDEAIANGAKAVFVQAAPAHARVPSEAITRKLGGVSFIEVPDTRKALARLAAAFYGYPSRALKMVGITGTNGKTTVSYLLEAILKEAGLRPAVIGTVSYRFNDTVIPAGNTTPAPLELESLLARMSQEGIGYAVMEVSSHALHQERVEGLQFHSAVFTNLTQDHLDYHGSLEDYFLAKAKLFERLSEGSPAVINADDPYGKRLASMTKARVITYGIESRADVVARDITFDTSRTAFTIETGSGKDPYVTPLIGRHNVYNCLAAVSWGMTEGLGVEAMRSALKRFSSVPGRLERIESPAGFTVFVDYAHTDDALANVLTTLRQLPSRRIIVVFGCGGERDRSKRPKMAAVVSKLADYAIITNDNPRKENPAGIIRDIEEGMRTDAYTVIPERLEAIRKAVTIAQPGDIVLVAGKGHENYQVLGERKVHFDDREAVRACLHSMNY